MPTEVRFLAEENILFLRCAGEVSAEELRTLPWEVAAAARQFGCSCILADAREFTTVLGTMEIHGRPALYAELGVPRSLKIAVIVPEKGIARDNYGFYETVCHNSGYHVMGFEDLASAKAWLAGENPSQWRAGVHRTGGQ